MNEQTVYQVPGNSHSSRQASVELLYTALSGDTAYKTNAIRTLNWATYTVDRDGKNRYIRDDIWLTDGYGDYVRHYLRAMNACPEVAPSHKNKLLGSTSVIASVNYSPDMITYRTFDNSATEVFRLTKKPLKIFAGDLELSEIVTNTETDVEIEAGIDDETGDVWNWKPLEEGGVLRIIHENSNEINIKMR